MLEISSSLLETKVIKKMMISEYFMLRVITFLNQLYSVVLPLNFLFFGVTSVGLESRFLDQILIILGISLIIVFETSVVEWIEKEISFNEIILKFWFIFPHFYFHLMVVH